MLWRAVRGAMISLRKWSSAFACHIVDACASDLIAVGADVDGSDDGLVEYVETGDVAIYDNVEHDVSEGDADGDGGDENLKDYPIEENPELTIRSVVNNQMLYQEGWGVGTIKHSLTYSGGLSRSYVRTYAPAHHFGFKGFSPFTRPDVVEVAEGIPFIELTDFDVDKLYALKGDIVAKGIKSVLGFDMPVFEKRRFQHGATSVNSLRENIPAQEGKLRKKFLELYS